MHLSFLLSNILSCIQELSYTYLYQFWNSWDVQSPAFIVGQVEVQFVQFVHCHGVNHLDDLVCWHEVPGNIDVDPSVVESRQVVEGSTWYWLIVVHETSECLDTVEDTLGVWGSDGDLPVVWLYLESVCFWACGLGQSLLPENYSLSACRISVDNFHSEFFCKIRENIQIKICSRVRVIEYTCSSALLTNKQRKTKQLDRETGVRLTQPSVN